ncbi:MAG: hypothetical protein P8Z34_13135 [Anaerolineales bacterium]|jgi:enoyl-[acyl-carrier-protein] reductase (NADH)
MAENGRIKAGSRSVAGSGFALWLLSDSSSFVTGVAVPIDGGFNAYSGIYLLRFDVRP